MVAHAYRTTDRRQTSSEGQVLNIVLEIVWKTVDRRQTSGAAEVLIVVLIAQVLKDKF